MSIFAVLAKVLFFCFLFGIPLAVVSALCSGLYLLFRFRRLSDDFRLYFACNCILPIILVYAAADILKGLSRWRRPQLRTSTLTGQRNTARRAMPTLTIQRHW